MNTNQTQPRRTGKQRGKYLATRHSHIVRYPANNVYYLYWKHKGKRYEQSLETDVESVALVKADEKIKVIKERLQTNAPVANGKISLGEVLSHYLAQEKRRVETHEIRAKTLEAIEDGVKKIRHEQAALLSREAARITFKELDDYVHGIRKESKSYHGQ